MVGLLGIDMSERRCSVCLVVEVGERSGLDRGEGAVRRLRGWETGTKVGTGARKHRVMILQVGHDARVIRPVPDGRLEDDALVVAFTLAFRLDAVGTRRPLFAALDSPFAAGQAAGFGPLPRLWV